MMLETNQLEKVITDLTYEFENRSDWVRIPLQIIKSVVNQPLILVDSLVLEAVVV